MSRLGLAALAGVFLCGAVQAQTYEAIDWLKVPAGRETLGQMHGDIAVSRAGEVYVSVETEHMGVQVFSPDGRYLRSLEKAPADLHGFVIRDLGDGEHIYGVSLRGQKFVKIAMDTRFTPVRIIATDRLNNRIVHLSLDGEFLGVVNDQLLLPAAVAIDGDNIVVGELNGRVTILDKAGKIVTHLGTSLDDGIGTNRVPPDKWRSGYVIAAHGVATNAEGDVFVSEFSTFGRVHKFDRR